MIFLKISKVRTKLKLAGLPLFNITWHRIVASATAR
jgi:hypothetical protein